MTREGGWRRLGVGCNPEYQVRFRKKRIKRRNRKGKIMRKKIIYRIFSVFESNWVWWVKPCDCWRPKKNKEKKKEKKEKGVQRMDSTWLGFAVKRPWPRELLAVANCDKLRQKKTRNAVEVSNREGSREIKAFLFWGVALLLSSSVTHRYVRQCMRVCCPAGVCVCVWEPKCLSLDSEEGRGGRRRGEARRGEEGGVGGVSCSIWSLTCCGALLRPPCLEVSSAGIGRLHASSIRGSILLLLCRLLSWGLLNWA